VLVFLWYRSLVQKNPILIFQSFSHCFKPCCLLIIVFSLKVTVYTNLTWNLASHIMHHWISICDFSIILFFFLRRWTTIWDWETLIFDQSWYRYHFLIYFYFVQVEVGVWSLRLPLLIQFLLLKNPMNKVSVEERQKKMEESRRETR
jgi:hypothetical protein